MPYLSKNPFTVKIIISMITQLTDSCYAISNPVSKQYLLSSNGLWILIDTGLLVWQKPFLEEVRKVIPGAECLSAILITHSDADHFGGAAYIRRETGAKVYASEIETLAIRKGQMSRKLRPKWYEKPFYWVSSILISADPVPVDGILKHGNLAFENSGLYVINTPGHTPGHVSFYWRSERILFAGDSIKKGRHGKPIPSSGANTWSAKKAERSFNEQMALQPVLIACGHALFDFRENTP